MAKQLNVNLAFTADTSKARAEINALNQSLTKISSGQGISGFGKEMKANLQEASNAAIQLKVHLQNAINTNTGTLNFNAFNQSLLKSNTSVEKLGASLLKAGTSGQQAFAQLTTAIAKSEVPLTRSNKVLKEFQTTLINTARWQISSSILHGFMGAIQGAYRYAQDLNTSLNNIRIVTGQSVDQMARFAEEANKAARTLSTTTTEYTNASLIYYQQGLTDQEVKQKTDITVKMANVAGINAQQASDQLTAIWNNFDNGTQSLEHYADVLVKLGAETASSSDEISQGMEKFAAVANTVGLSYEYAAAALATVTATTRQSADTVGTAFKTLFARLEGLQLGETLEDGTDLNKYSKALATVGVDIKDVSGQMKDMDTILSELGAKWQTLGKDQQIALAQTVGGMRQYNQLIALMDHWDFFEQNLALAKNADGALQGQADIYAESWEAARDRVRAATESIFQDLLKDKGFIGLLNVFEDLLVGVDNFIDGLGGLKGILLSVGAIATNVFGKKIAAGITDFGISIKGIIKGPQWAQQQKLNAFNSLKEQYTSATTGQNGIPVTETARAQQQVNNTMLDTQALYLMNASKMTEQERMVAQNAMDALQVAGEKKIQAHSNFEQANERYRLAREKSGYSIDESNMLNATYGARHRIGKILGPENDGTNTQVNAVNIKNLEKDLKTLGVANLDQIIEAVKKIGEASNESSEEVQKLIDEFQILQNLKTDLDGLVEPEDADEDGGRQAKFEGAAINRANAEDERDNENDRYTAMAENVQEGISNIEITQPSGTEKIIAMSSAFMALGTAASSAKGIIDTWNNTELSFGEKLTTTLTSGSMAVMMFMQAMQQLQGVTLSNAATTKIADAIIKSSIGTKIANSAATTAQAAATGVDTAAIVQNTAARIANLAVIGAAIVALGLLALAISKAAESHKTFEEGQQAVGEIYSGIDEEIKKLQDLETELENIQDKVKDLQNQGGLNLTEAKELSDLQQQEALLQNELELQKQLYQVELERQLLEAEKNHVGVGQSKILKQQPTVASKDEIGSLMGYASEEIDAVYSQGYHVVNGQNISLDNMQEYRNAFEVLEYIMKNAQEQGVTDWQEVLEHFQSNGYDITDLLTTTGTSYEDLITQFESDLIFGRAGNEDSYITEYKNDWEDLINSYSLNTEAQQIRDVLPDVEITTPEEYEESIIQPLQDYADLLEKVENGEDLNDSEKGRLESFQKIFRNLTYEDVFTKLAEARANADEFTTKYTTWMSDIGTQLQTISNNYQHYLKILELSGREIDPNDPEIIKYWEELKGFRLASVAGNEDKYEQTYIDPYLSSMGKSVDSQSLDNIYTAVATGTTDLSGIDSVDTEKLQDWALTAGIPVEEFFGRIVEIAGPATEAITKFKEDLDGNELKEFEEQLNSLTAEQWEVFFDLLVKNNDVQTAIDKAMAYDGKSIAFTLEEADSHYNRMQEIADKIGSGQSISDEDYDYLVKNGIDGSSFTRAAGGGWNASAAYTAENEEFLREAADDQYEAIVDESLKKYQEARERGFIFDDGTEFQVFASESIPGSLGDDISAGQEELQDRAKFLEEYAGQTYTVTDESGEESEVAVNDVIDKIDAASTSDDVDAVNEALRESSDLIQTIGYDLEDAGLMSQDTAFAIQAMEAAEFNEIMQHFGYTMEDLIPYIEKIKQLNPNWKEAGTDIKAQALAMKALEEGLDGYEDSLEDLEEEEARIGEEAAATTEAFDDFHSRVEKIIGQKLDKEFTRALKAAGKLTPEVVRTEKGIQSLNKTVAKMKIAKSFKAEGEELEQTLKDIAEGTEDSEELFQEWADSLGITADDFASNVSDVLDGIETFNAGDIISDGDLQAKCNSIFQQLLASTGSWDKAVTEMTKLGVRPDIELMDKLVPEQTAYTPGPGMFGTLRGNFETGEQSILYIPMPVVSEATAPEYTTYAPQIVFRKIGDGTVGGDPPPSTGGGRGGGGGGKAKPPKPLKRIDPKVRYDGIKQRISNLSKQQDKVAQQKESAYGKEKIKQAEKEIELKQRQIKLQTEYMEETKNALELQKIDVADSLKAIGAPAVEFDIDGSIKNYAELEEALLNYENDMIRAENAGADEFYMAAMEERFDTAREGFDNLQEIIEDALDAELEYYEALNELAELNLELIQMEVDMDIAIAESKLEYIDYMLEKLKDEGYDAADAIAQMGNKVETSLDQIGTYTNAITELLSRYNLTIEDLQNATPEDLIGLGIRQDEVEALLEWNSGLIESLTTLSEIRTEVADRLSGAFGAFSEDLSRQIDLFEHYNDLLEHFSEIATLTGSKFAKSEFRDLFNTINNSIMANSQNNIRASKQQLEDLRAAQAEILKAYNDAVALNDGQAIFEYKEALQEIEDAIIEAEETFYSSFEDTLDKATELLETWVEQAGERFDEVLSPMYKSLDLLQDAYDRQVDKNSNFYQDFEQLYHLSQLTRDISNSIDDTDSIKGKQRLRDLMKEITDIQAQGVKLSEYDADILRKRYELEVARQNLEDAYDNASLVRLQRDQEGNWGYVYTADEEAVDEAEKEYENKLYELQKANDEYIKELEEKYLDITANVKEQLAEIASDISLTPEEKDKQMKDILNYYETQTAHYTQQLESALTNQKNTYDLTLEMYKVGSANLMDAYHETNLGLLGMYDSTDALLNGLTTSMRSYIKDLQEGIDNFDKNINDTNIAAGVKDTFGFLEEKIEGVNDRSKETLDLAESIGDTFIEEFGKIGEEISNIENMWASMITSIIGDTELLAESLIKAIEILREYNTEDTQYKEAWDEYQTAQQKYLKGLGKEVTIAEIRYSLADTDNAEWEAAKDAWNQFLVDWMKQKSGGIEDSGQSFDTGGYTGEWGPDGRLAWLHQKELILNASDTENLLDAIGIVRALELNVDTFTNRLVDIMPMVTTMEREAFQQEIYITAEFPDATSAIEIQEAFENLINDAAQYANQR